MIFKKTILILLQILLIVFFSMCKNESEFAKSDYVSLRSEYKQINDFKEIKEMIFKYNFFDKRKNRSGSFQGQLKEQKIGDHSVILDSKTGLMWMAQDRNDPLWIKADNNIEWLKPFFYKDAEKMITILNSSKSGYAGFKDWRLPTVEEAASLLRKQANPDSLYLPENFSKKNTIVLYIWTGDYYNLNFFKKKNMIWTVSFAAGGIFRESNSNPQYIKLVRKINPVK